MYLNIKGRLLSNCDHNGIVIVCPMQVAVLLWASFIHDCSMMVNTILAVNRNPDYLNPMCVTRFLTAKSEIVQIRVEAGGPTPKSYQVGFMPQLTFVCFVLSSWLLDRT